MLASWWVLAAVATVVTLAALVGVRQLRLEIAGQAVDSAVVGARSINLLVVNRNLTVDDIAGGVVLGSRDSMDGDLVLLRARDELLGLRVWAMSDGHQVYGDVDHRGGGGSLDRRVLERARLGQVSTAFREDRASAVDALVVYLPLDADDDGTVDAVTEIILPRARVDGAIGEYPTALNVGAAVVLALTLFVLVSVGRRQAARDHAATHDALTGLGNRVLLSRVARPALGRATESSPSALLLVDLDGFKGVNDTLGHLIGDELLVVVAGRLRRVCRPTDCVIRLGGDEFAVLLAGLAERAAGERIGHGLVEAVRQPVPLAGVSVQVDASVGVAYAPEHGTRLDELLRRADVAMEEAKRRGGRVVVYDPGLDPMARQSTSLLPELRRALADGELVLHFQPVCDERREVREVEALLRWNHPTRGLLLAEEFLPLAEQTSLVLHLDSWMVRAAARQCAEWREQGIGLTVSANVSTRSLLDGLLTTRIQAATSDAGLPPSALRIEVCESAFLGRRRGKVVEALRALGAAGIEVSIDGIRGGCLAFLGVDEVTPADLKIHPSLAAQAPTDRVARTVVTTINEVARQLGARSVASGVETVPSWHRLARLGCVAVQGQVLTPPLPADHLLAWVRRWPTAGCRAPVDGRRSPVDECGPVPEREGPT